MQLEFDNANKYRKQVRQLFVTAVSEGGETSYVDDD